MRAACFVDTNIVLYRASTDQAERPKRLVAEQILRRSDIGISAQVLAEFYHNAVTKPGLRLPAEIALRAVDALSLLPVVPLTAELVRSAITLQQRYGISYWDSAIIAAAKELTATIILSEDLAHGQSYDGITVLNPFLPGMQIPE